MVFKFPPFILSDQINTDSWKERAGHIFSEHVIKKNIFTGILLTHGIARVPLILRGLLLMNCMGRTKNRNANFPEEHCDAKNSSLVR